MEAWWTVLGESTYERVEADRLPRLPEHLLGSLSWLSGLEPYPADENVLRSDQAQRPLSPEGPSWLVAQGVPEASIPHELSELMRTPSLLSGIGSVTLCFVDLGDVVQPLDASAGGGWLVRFLSDSQLVRSWLVHVAVTGEHRVVTTPAWIGYDEPYEPDEPYPVPRRALTSADLERLEVEVCAPSLTAFLARFWLEDEAWRALHGSDVSDDATRYLAEWRRLNP